MQGVALGLALATSSCEDEFPLGSWGITPAPSATATAGMGGMGGSPMPTDTTEPPPPPPPACGDTATPDMLNAPGGDIGTTKLYTDWNWPAPIESIEWDLVIESDPKDDGYYWAHQFSFADGIPGYFGLQAHGGYQEDPTPTPSMPGGSQPEFVKMALLWVLGAAEGEVGDIPFPDARAAVVSTGSFDWMTVHARFEWEACHLYHLKLAKQSVSADGDDWYGFWIEDRTLDVETFIGRVLVPATSGPFSSLTTSFTTRIDDAPGAPVLTCADPEPASGIFGLPSANEGDVRPLGHKNRFNVPARCASSRFTDLDSGVRQEIGLRTPTN
jgi:hypothetical protein